ncbi:hypothetical protein Ancab_021154 [Ancistrocladus abbreviatus]
MTHHAQKLNYKHVSSRFVVRDTAKEIAFDQGSSLPFRLALINLQMAVGLTLGPRGRNVVLDEFGSPKVVNDGVTIARATELANAMENASATLIREKGIGETIHGLVEELEKKAKLVKGRDDIKGTEFQATDLGLLVENTSVEQLGLARKVTIAKDSTTIIAEVATKDELQARNAQLKKDLFEIDYVYDSKTLSERTAKLSGGVAVIQVGDATKTKLKDRKLRNEDAKNATFAAVEKSIVPGGGASLVHLSMQVPTVKDKYEDLDEHLGVDIVSRLLSFVLVGTRSTSIPDCPQCWARCLKEIDYNAMSNEYGNLVEAGVIDQAKVTRCVLHNAASFARMVLTTQAIIVEKPKPKAPAAAAPQGLTI